MIERQHINKKDVWLKVDPLHVHRENPNIIPTEYFTVSYYLQQPSAENTDGRIIKDENDEPKLFESPVAAISYAAKKLQEIL
jgi:hypothetical protein